MSSLPPIVPPGASAVSTIVDEALDPQSVRISADGSHDSNAMPSILLQGEQGHGKSYAIRSLLDCGFDRIIILSLEPGVADTFGDLPPSQVQWKFIGPYSAKMPDLIKAYKQVQTMSNDSLQKLGHIGREKYQQFIQCMAACNEFVSDRDGEVLGNVGNFPANWAFVIDGLSGLSIIVTHFTIGLKPFLDMRDYQAIQNPIMEFLNTLTNDSKCLFVMTAHLEPELDENTNRTVLMMSTVGRKLAPRLGKFFSDVIWTKKSTADGKVKFSWTTDSSDVRCKTRNLPLAKDLLPTFKQLVENWRAKQAKGVK